MSRKRNIWLGLRIFLLAAALVLIAGLAAPKFQAGQNRGKIRTALEKALNRKVEFGEIRYNLFTGPGFSVDNVTIGEDPELGAEPIAYVNSSKLSKLTAVPRLWSLWTGHLEFSSLRLDDAQINLTRSEPRPGQYRWNVERLMRPSIIAAFPTISIRNSRINFKADDIKSTVYLLDCDLDITPPSSAKDGWHVRFEGKPARTDRPARGSGLLTAKGAWYPSTGNLDLDLLLDRSELSDLVALVRGEDIGLQGEISGKAHLAGPPSAIGINGRLNIAQLHGWDQSEPQGEVWPLNLSGTWNLRDQQLKMDAGVASKVAVHYLVDKYFSQPRWGVSVSIQDFAVEPLVNVARHLGAPLPPDLRLKGQLDAAVGYSGTLNGGATLHKAELSVPGSEPVQLETAQVMITDGHARLSPTLATFPDQQQATFEATYNVGDPAPEFSVSTDALNVHALAGIPLLTALPKGEWSGSLRFAHQTWSGNFELSNAVIGFPAFTEPVKLSAEGRLDGARVSLQRIRANAGGITAQGEYRYEPGTLRPHRFRLTVPELDTATLERLAMPALSHKGGIFSFGKTAPPEWLKQLRADGTIQIAVLHAAALELTSFHSRVIWDGSHIALPDAAAAIASGSVISRVLMDLGGRVPAYEVFSQFTGIAWKTGKVDADTVVETSGLGAETLSHLRSTGSFAGRNVLDDYESITGRFDLRWSSTAPRLTFTDLRLTGDGEVATGNAALQNDGTVLMQLVNGTRQLSERFDLLRRLDPAAR
jgi:hypothetical protein